MAPSGRNRGLNHAKNEDITNIADLDSASTSSRADYLRSPSVNIPIAATYKANTTTENDDLNSDEIVNVEGKVTAEDVFEDGTEFELLDTTDIQCLGGVDHDPNKSVVTNVQRPPPIVRLKSWRSSGKKRKSKKRKKLPKKKVNKRQKTSSLMTSTSSNMETFDCTDTDESCSDSELSSEDEMNDEINTYKMRNCKITAGDGKNKTGTQGNCVTTQTACGSAKGNKKVQYPCAKPRRGGAAGGDGDDGDDERGKPPRKPPEHTVGNTSRKVKKENKDEEGADLQDPEVAPGTSNNQEMASAHHEENLGQPLQSEQPQPQQCPRQLQIKQAKELLIKYSSHINHANTKCRKESCDICNWVQTMFTHYFDDNKTCGNCQKCQLCFHVFNYHTGVCQFKDRCQVCKRSKQGMVRPAATATVVQQSHLNVPTCRQSLDQDELIVWRDQSFPNDISHFKENYDYFVHGESGEGGHGKVHNIGVTDEIKKKCFSTECIDLVVKTCPEVGDDEKYLLQQTSKHPNFVQTYCVMQKMQPKLQHRIIMEKCEMTLKDHVRNLAKDGKSMDIYEAMFYWTQTFDALKHLHYLRIPVIHKDIKAENVLLSIKDNLVRVKLADYDTVKQLHNEVTQPGLKVKGTAGLVSPEVFRQEPHGRPADVWNMGMFLLQLLFVCDFQNYQKMVTQALKNFGVCRMMSVVQSFIKQKVAELRRMDPKLADLIQCCLQEDPKNRPTSVQVLEHPAVSKYSKNKMNMDSLIKQICPVSSY